MAKNDQLPFATPNGQTKNPGGGASGAHDFTTDPVDGAPKTGGGYIAKDRPQQSGVDETINKESVIEGGKLPFPTTQMEDKGTGTIGLARTPFKGLKG